MTDAYYRLPRLYISDALTNDSLITLSENHAHYLRTVMRRKDGESVRLFNGRDGEWLATLESLKKKSGEARISEQIRPQDMKASGVHLYFAPITRNRMDWLIEKAVELGVSDFHPVLTQNTEVRKIREDRLAQQMIEAAEQSERLSVPQLHPLAPLPVALKDRNMQACFLACLERTDARPLLQALPKEGDIAILIGPVGGFTENEKEEIAALPGLQAVSLGSNVLRCETAALYALSVIGASRA